MQKSIKAITKFIVILLFGFILTGCGEEEPPKVLIETFDFKEASYEIRVEDHVTVELLLDENVVKENIQYESKNPEIATFVKGILKGVAVGETTITISYKDVDNDLSKTITVKVALSASEQAAYDAAKDFDARVDALSNFTASDEAAIKALVDEVNAMDTNILKYVTKGDLVIEMYNEVRALPVIELIRALPAVVKVEDQVQIEAARAAYATLDAQVRGYVTNFQDLVTKEDELAAAIWDATPDKLEISYEDTSLVKVNGNLKINATTYKNDPDTVIEWKSSNSAVASVVDGVVTGKKEGSVIITATIQGTEYTMSLGVTVVSGSVSAAMQLVLDSHNDVTYWRRNLMIGAGGGYYANISGSVSDLLYNHELVIDESYLEAGNASGDYYTNAVADEGLEFITVHYTAGLASTADTDNHAAYFTGGTSDTSIHYITGNQGTYSNGQKSAEVFKTLDHSHGAWHAGDSGAYNLVGPFKWIATGIKYDNADLMHLDITISDDYYYEINGKKTSVPMPEPWDYNGRSTNHIMNEDGTLSSQPTYAQNGFTNRDPESFINKQDIPVTVKDGEYYIGTTWWCYSQIYEGRICSTGGNRNSIGIESCVNEGSDLWYTWQVTAKLVAQLMDETGLDITRVKGHHFFTAKNCPQPMMVYDLEIWWEFIDMIQAEYQKLTEFVGYEFILESLNPDIIDNHGRVIADLEAPVNVSYKVTIKYGSKTETVTLHTLVNATPPIK